jgi:hypothetical protein
MKIITKAILISILLIITGCGKQENSALEKGQSSTSKIAPKSPSLSLHEAAFHGNLEAIHQHIKAGSDLNEKDPSGGGSPLSTAITFGQTEAVRALIEAGADVNYKNNVGSTPLHVAAFFCRSEIVQELLDNGADQNLRNNTGSTALESVEGPFEDIKGIYDYFGSTLRPLGLELDYERIKMTRPKIAKMLR